MKTNPESPGKTETAPGVGSSELDARLERAKDHEDNQDTIVAIKPCCGRVVFAAVNLPHVVDTKMRKEIGELSASGCTIEHWPALRVRKANWGCNCKRI